MLELDGPAPVAPAALRAALSRAAGRLDFTPALDVSTLLSPEPEPVAGGPYLPSVPDASSVVFPGSFAGPVDSVYHAAKVYETGGPFGALAPLPPARAGALARSVCSPHLGFYLPSLPTSVVCPSAEAAVFYSWLVVTAIAQGPGIDWALHYFGFTSMFVAPSEPQLPLLAWIVAAAVAMSHRGHDLVQLVSDFAAFSNLLGTPGEPAPQSHTVVAA